MEEIRGLAYANVTAGLLSTDLAGDANIVDCSGVMRFMSCTVDSDFPGSAEQIVSSPALPTTVPLVPHRSSTAPNTDPVRDGTTYQWSTYVTQDDAVENAPYRVTVLVSWAGGAVNAPNKFVRVQSLFWSPIGCRSTNTHPFAAPCQPFFFGRATVPQGNVTVSGTVVGTSFTSGELFTAGVSSSAQQEQIDQVQGAWLGPEATITDDAGTQSVGGTSASTNADSDPATSTPAYSRSRCPPVDPTDVMCESGSVSSGSATTITFTAPGSTTAESDSTSAAGAVNVCPPDATENDGMPCGGGKIHQGSTLSTTLDIGAAALGGITVIQAQAPATESTVLANRTTFGSTTGCTPTSTADGCLAMTANRYVGTMNIGSLPTAIAAPTGWAGSDAWNGYFLSLVGYQDSLTGSAGTESPLPTGSMSGTIYYYNGSGYSSLSVLDGSLNGLDVSYTTEQLIGGDTVTVTITTDPAGMAAGSTSLSPTTPSGSATRTEVDAQAVPPGIVVRYTITVNSAVVVDLTVTVNLGALDLRGTYAAAPVEGT